MKILIAVLIGLPLVGIIGQLPWLLRLIDELVAYQNNQIMQQIITARDALPLLLLALSLGFLLIGATFAIAYIFTREIK